MRKILFFLAVFAAIFYLSQNTIAGTVYGSVQTCYYGSNCAQQGYSTPGEVYCSDWFATYENGYPTCRFGSKCCGSLDYCSQTLWNNPQPVPSACTQANCYYINQVNCLGGKVCSSSGCICPSDKPNWDGTNCISCPSGTTWDGTKCKAPTSACSDGTAEGACCTEPGKKCKNDGTGNLVCQTDPTCPNCYDTDPSNDPKVKGTCYDTVNFLCGFTSGGCTDTCASNGAVTEYYCAGGKSCMPTTSSCSSTYVCDNGICRDTEGSNPPPGSGGCSWWSSTFSICSSGCPTSYPNQQYTCCASAGGGCNPGTSGCASYDPLKGETPCCTAGGYYTCDKQEICTETGCKNLCTGADKTSELYCSKCNSCQDGVQNCGETGVDTGGANCGQPCTVPVTKPYTTPGTYGGFTCAAVGNNKCQAYAPVGAYDISCISLGGCSSGEFGCWWNCQAKFDVFNTASCSDGVQNCAETCVDGGAQCNAGTKETDASYLVTFDYTEPSGLSGTKFYSDAESWNCADGVDNDKDCFVDCADPDCIGKSLACPPIPSAVVSINPVPPCTGDPKTSWIDCAASASISCQDKSGTGCNANSYGYKLFSSNPGNCPDTKSSYSSGGSILITDHKWLCAYVEDNAGNSGVSTPIEEVKVNRTFTIQINARAYGEIDVPVGSEVKAYLCDPSQYYCNQDSQYLAAASGAVGADRNFRITFVQVLVRGTTYKIGLQTEKGYAESEFVA